MTKVEVVTKSDCPYCDQVKDWLSDKGIPFDAVAHDDAAARQTFYDEHGLTGDARAVPQVFVILRDTRFRIGGAQATMRSRIESLFDEQGRAR